MSLGTPKALAGVMLAALMAGVGSSDAAPRNIKLASEDGMSWLEPGKFNGKPAVFLFWDTECSACLQELANVAALRESFPDATLIAVSLSSRMDTRRALAQVTLPAEVLHARAPDNPSGLLAKLGNRDGALPFSAVFRRNGELCAYALGTLTATVMARAAEQCR